MNLEFPYHLRKSYALGVSALLASLSIGVSVMELTISHPANFPSDELDYVEILAPIACGILAAPFPMLWFFGRHRVLRLTDDQLDIPDIRTANIIQLRDIRSMWITGKGSRRVIEVKTVNGAGSVSQLMLPDPEAFDQVYQTLARKVQAYGNAITVA